MFAVLPDLLAQFHQLLLGIKVFSHNLTKLSCLVGNFDDCPLNLCIVFLRNQPICLTIMGKPPALPGDSSEFDISGNIKETSYS
jgi:hypothetical protein